MPTADAYLVDFLALEGCLAEIGCALVGEVLAELVEIEQRAINGPVLDGVAHLGNMVHHVLAYHILLIGDDYHVEFTGHS